MVAVGLLQLHVPPDVVSVKVIVELTHTSTAPAIVSATGSGLIVIVSVAVAVPQVFVTEYTIVSMPADTPETTPLLTVADALLLVQTPPGAASVKVIAEPAHTLDKPVIVPAAGNGLTVTNFVATAVLQTLVTE